MCLPYEIKNLDLQNNLLIHQTSENSENTLPFLNPLSPSFFTSLFDSFLNSDFSFKHFAKAFDIASADLTPPPPKKKTHPDKHKLEVSNLVSYRVELPDLTIPHIFLPPREINFLLCWQDTQGWDNQGHTWNLL